MRVHLGLVRALIRDIELWLRLDQLLLGRKAQGLGHRLRKGEGRRLWPKLLDFLYGRVEGADVAAFEAQGLGPVKPMARSVKPSWSMAKER